MFLVCVKLTNTEQYTPLDLCRGREVMVAQPGVEACDFTPSTVGRGTQAVSQPAEPAW